MEGSSAAWGSGSLPGSLFQQPPPTRAGVVSLVSLISLGRAGWGGHFLPSGSAAPPPPLPPHPRDGAGTRVPCTYLYF